MAFKIFKYTVFELWQNPPEGMIFILKIQKQPIWHKAPYVVLDEDEDILSTFAQAKADVKRLFEAKLKHGDIST